MPQAQTKPTAVIDDTVAVTINVTNVDETGAVSIAPAQPQQGTALTAALTDPDGGVSGETWQWSKSLTADGTFTNISGATQASYTPVSADAGNYLRATVSYADAQGSGKNAAATTQSAVAAAPSGTVTGFTLSSDAPGSLTIGWDPPSPAPTDYRIRFAPTDQDFLSWNAANEALRAAGTRPAAPRR